MPLGTLAASLFENSWSGKGVIHANEGEIKAGGKLWSYLKFN